MSKVRFKKEYEDVTITIPSKRLVISKYNIEQDGIQAILKKFPQYAHNFEPVTNEDGSAGVQVGTFLEGGGTEVDLLADAPTVPVKKSKPSTKAVKTKSAKGTKKAK